MRGCCSWSRRKWSEKVAGALFILRCVPFLDSILVFYGPSNALMPIRSYDMDTYRLKGEQAVGVVVLCRDMFFERLIPIVYEVLRYSG